MLLFSVFKINWCKIFKSARIFHFSKTVRTVCQCITKVYDQNYGARNLMDGNRNRWKYRRLENQLDALLQDL